jgi:hypothetical protein
VEESGDSGRGDRNHVDEHHDEHHDENHDEYHDDHHHHDRAVSGSYSCEFVSRSLSLA